MVGYTFDNKTSLQYLATNRVNSYEAPGESGNPARRKARRSVRTDYTGQGLRLTVQGLIRVSR